jgi:hypothetical protein
MFTINAICGKHINSLSDINVIDNMNGSNVKEQTAIGCKEIDGERQIDQAY